MQNMLKLLGCRPWDPARHEGNPRAAKALCTLCGNVVAIEQANWPTVEADNLLIVCVACVERVAEAARKKGRAMIFAGHLHEGRVTPRKEDK